MMATVKISPLIAKDEAFVMKRLHQIVRGDDNGPFEKNSGYKWQLDASNDWWAELDGRVLTVAHRYSQDKANALAQIAGLLFEP